MCKLHPCLNPRSHGHLSTWLCPPDPHSNQLVDSMVSPLPRIQFWPFLNVFPRLLALLTHQSILKFTEKHTDKCYHTLCKHFSLWTGTNEALVGRSQIRKMVARMSYGASPPDEDNPSIFTCNCLGRPDWKAKHGGLILTAHRFKELERLSAYRQQKSYWKLAQDNTIKSEEDSTL